MNTAETHVSSFISVLKRDINDELTFLSMRNNVNARKTHTCDKLQITNID